MPEITIFDNSLVMLNLNKETTRNLCTFNKMFYQKMKKRVYRFGAENTVYGKLCFLYYINLNTILRKDPLLTEE